MPVIYKHTGKEPTPEEWEMIKKRAVEILNNPYAAPEQAEWAADMHPEAYAKLAHVLFDNPER